MSTLESTIENSLIQQLTEGESQWTYRPDITNETQLWNNFRDKLNQNNLAVLNGKLITDSEFEQIKGAMLDNSKTTYDAALWLAGEHGIAQITLEREDASLGKVTLMVINSREIAGGTSSYEVINQYWSTDLNQISRFDVTLLINGVPIIHIELKNSHHPYMDAFRQIDNYCKEGQFSGLFGFVQMFVVSNVEGTRYIAADKRGEMSEEFLIRWVDENNNPVENLKDFAREVLNIPMAHEMVGKYAVLDQEKKRQIILRPYQVHAIEKVRQAAKEGKSGYIWHTTGSGKTLTSYTVTKNLFDIPSVDKTLFLIDRRDLDRQTSDNFKSYAENDDIDVDDTNSTFDLERKLTSKARIAIVTTIQKLQNIIRKCTAENPKPGAERLKKALQSKKLAFVIDECHRTVSPQTKRAIESFFPIPTLWFGFTGTPIFVENKRAALGNLPQTTEELFGPCLHQYTIKEALADKSVLGFQIHNLGRSTEDLQQIATKNKLFSEEEMQQMTAIDLEEAVIKKCTDSGIDIYGNKEHRQQVVQYICGPNSIGKMRLDSDPGKGFCALLTCTSIKQAQEYYKEFKAYKESGKVSEQVKALLPDFPKVAITYTLGENGEGDQVNKKEMEESLADYKKMFPRANAEIDNIAAYNADLNQRIARAGGIYQEREEQLDIVIVVDRLLTGFDAPPLSTIFLDRPPMAPQHLIQAFSRTNRKYVPVKKFGQVVTMQFPAAYEQKIDEALLLYSHGGLAEVSAPTWDEILDKLKKAVGRLIEIAPTPEDAMKLPNELEPLAKFISAYQLVDHLFSSIATYDQYDPKTIKDIVGIDVKDLGKYTGHYQNKKEEFRKLVTIGGIEPPGPTFIEVDLGHELETVKIVEVNYSYLMHLIQAHVEDNLPETPSKAIEEKIGRYLDNYKTNHPQIGEIVEQIWFEIKMRPEAFIGKDITEEVQERIKDLQEEKMKDFAKEWQVSERALQATKDAWNGSDEVTIDGNYDAYVAEGGTDSKLRYKRKLREAVNTLFAQTIRPYSHF